MNDSQLILNIVKNNPNLAATVEGRFDERGKAVTRLGREINALAEEFDFPCLFVSFFTDPLGNKVNSSVVNANDYTLPGMILATENLLTTLKKQFEENLRKAREQNRSN